MSNIYKKEVFSYSEKTNKRIIDYKFWEINSNNWHVLCSKYDVDFHEPQTTEMIIPEEILNKMLAERAKGKLNE